MKQYIKIIAIVSLFIGIQAFAVTQNSLNNDLKTAIGGRLSITVPDTANYNGLTVTNNDDTNNKSAIHAITSYFVADTDGFPLIVENSVGSSGNIKLFSNSSEPSTFETISNLVSVGRDSALNEQIYGTQRVITSAVTSGSESAYFSWDVLNSGSLQSKLHLRSSYLGPASNDGTSLGTSIVGWSDLYLASGGIVDFNNNDARITHSSDALSITGSELVLSAGTTTIAPLKFTSGTNLTTSEAGGFEYDGKVFMSSPVASARGVSPSVMYSIVSSSNFSLSTSSGVQSAFPSTGDVWTLGASTSYLVEGQYYITRTTNSVTTAMAFAFSSAPTSILYTAEGQTGVAINTTGTATNVVMINTASSTVVLPTATTGGWIKFKGIIRTNGATTVTPQVNFSGTTTSPVMNANSYITFTPIGGNTQNTMGNVQ